MIQRLPRFAPVCAGLLLLSSAAAAQSAPARADSVTITVRVMRDSVAEREPVAGAVLRSGASRARTDASGTAQLRLAPGAISIVVNRIGFRMDSLALQAARDTSVDFHLSALAEEAEAIMVTSTRTERRVEDTPLRVEVIDEEEIAEKVAMAPGDIAMMLNETSGLRVQPTNPSLGGANVRIQGLRGRYSLLLADGLPLYGGQAGSLGLLQIPPVDLGRVEIIKGTASALYGSSALGGVIDLVSRRPGEETERTLLVNQTSRGGTDAAFFGAIPFNETVGMTLLVTGNRQQQNDIDGDGWTDMAGYKRAVIRPRLYFDNREGRSLFVTGGFTTESRKGGTLDGRSIPAFGPFGEALRTTRSDAGALGRWLLSSGPLDQSIVTVRGSGVEQRHTHTFGTFQERDRHRTWFGEASIAVPRGIATFVVGTAFQRESYKSQTLPTFDYAFDIPSVFVQTDVDARSWLALSTSVRADRHSAYGTVVNPRVSVLLRREDLPEWSVRLSGGTGAFAPTPFVEEVEVTGLRPLRPLAGLRAERATSAALDIGGPVQSVAGRIELNATVFGSRVQHPLQILTIDLPAVPTTQMQDLQLSNALQPTRTWGGELLARLVHPFGDDDESPTLRITTTYTYLRSRECTPVDPTVLQLLASACSRREVPLTPRHAAGMVATVEQEGTSRIGLEAYFTGRQELDNNPYRAQSTPYLILGLMGERAFPSRAGTFRVFVNLENFTDVRQSKYDPVRLPSPGSGGRWTTDAWTDLSGFTANGGVRFVW
ncbi:MAG: TonB-dependent receptor [Gemmatimonas sp.]